MTNMNQSPAQKLLSFVTDDNGDRVTIHADKNGLDLIIKELTWLRQKLETGECDHTHLISPDWAGDELTTSKLRTKRMR
jgi:hypothetical protein